MKQASMISRYLLGLMFLVFGLNGFLNFLPTPPSTEAATAFGGALFATGYFFPFLKATEVVTALLLLSGFAVPLALIILAPIVIQIVLFHMFLTPGISNSVLPLVLVVLGLLSAYNYREKFTPLFK